MCVCVHTHTNTQLHFNHCTVMGNNWVKDMEHFSLLQSFWFAKEMTTLWRCLQSTCSLMRPSTYTQFGVYHNLQMKEAMFGQLLSCTSSMGPWQLAWPSCFPLNILHTVKQILNCWWINFCLAQCAAVSCPMYYILKQAIEIYYLELQSYS